MMDIGPIQLIAFAFERTDRFKGEIIKELNDLRKRGVIRVLDLLFVMKDEQGNVMSFQDSQLSAEEEREMGNVLTALLGLDGGATAEGQAASEALAMAEAEYGLTMGDIQALADQIEPGQAAAMLLVEHGWATGFRDALLDAGGRMVAQGFLTPQVIMMVGREIQAVAEAEAAIEMAHAVKGAAILDALATMVEAEAVKEAAIEEAVETVVAAELVKTAAVADAVRTLIVAGMIEEAAAEEAVATLLAAGLLEAAAVEHAEGVIAQAEAVAAAAGTKDDDSTSMGEPA
ncbi:MAG: hypothetical protein KDJ65_28015 [Anaerolineae bacterium]|nr:hypothetical protein [Anaerolineae bacterium]